MIEKYKKANKKNDGKCLEERRNVRNHKISNKSGKKVCHFGIIVKKPTIKSGKIPFGQKRGNKPNQKNKSGEDMCFKKCFADVFFVW